MYERCNAGSVVDLCGPEDFEIIIGRFCVKFRLCGLTSMFPNGVLINSLNSGMLYAA